MRAITIQLRANETYFFEIEQNTQKKKSIRNIVF